MLKKDMKKVLAELTKLYGKYSALAIEDTLDGVSLEYVIQDVVPLVMASIQYTLNAAEQLDTMAKKVASMEASLERLSKLETQHFCELKDEAVDIRKRIKAE